MLSHSELAAIFRRLADELEVAQPLSEAHTKPYLDTVLSIQQAFNSLRSGPAENFPKLVEDGVHGPVMTFALKEFQATVGIPVTGEADEATIQAIRKAMFPHSHP